VNSAVSNVSGELSLKFNENQSITTSASIFDNDLGSDIEVVQSTTLAEILIKNQINEIDFLKLDCEGAEYDILYQSPLEVLRTIKNVAIETP
jgi:FkbM family methyltransferase